LEGAIDPRLELERNRVVVQLAGAVAHKLKQPLAVAWGYLELLLDDPDVALAPSTRRYVREIQESLRDMDKVINRLQQATTAQTRPYASSMEILDLDLHVDVQLNQQ
jgi:signal transduction histidine kinase